jgi:hypothetical protein
VRLLDEGKIVFHKAGTHRRIYLEDFVSFRKERDRRPERSGTAAATPLFVRWPVRLFRTACTTSSDWPAQALKPSRCWTRAFFCPLP